MSTSEDLKGKPIPVQLAFAGSVPQRKGYIRKLVPPRLLDAHLGLGWSVVAGKGPDGAHRVGDTVVVEMEEKQYVKLTEAAREPSERLRQKVERGESPVEVNEEGVALTSEKATVTKQTITI